MPGSYTNAHRIFLQCLLSAKCMESGDVEDLVKKCWTRYLAEEEIENEPEPTLESFVAAVNSKLELLDMRLERTRHPESGAAFYILVNTVADEISLLMTPYAETEIAGVKVLISAIMESTSPPYQLGSTAALSLLRRQCKMEGKRAEAFIDRFVKDGWVNETNGKLSPSLQLQTSLKRYLTNLYPEIPQCHICHELCIAHSLLCSQCGELGMHTFCEQKFKDARLTKCPGCDAPWEGVKKRPAGREDESRQTQENGEDDDNEEMEPTQSRTQRKTQRSKQRRRSDDMEIDDDNDNENESQEETQYTQQTQQTQSRKKKSKTRKASPSETEDSDPEEEEESPSSRRKGKKKSNRYMDVQASSDHDEEEQEDYEDEEERLMTGKSRRHRSSR